LAKCFFSKNPDQKRCFEDRTYNDFQLQILLNGYAK